MREAMADIMDPSSWLDQSTAGLLSSVFPSYGRRGSRADPFDFFIDNDPVFKSLLDLEPILNPHVRKQEDTATAQDKTPGGTSSSRESVSKLDVKDPSAPASASVRTSSPKRLPYKRVPGQGLVPANAAESGEVNTAAGTSETAVQADADSAVATRDSDDEMEGAVRPFSDWIANLFDSVMQPLMHSATLAPSALMTTPSVDVVERDGQVVLRAQLPPALVTPTQSGGASAGGEQPHRTLKVEVEPIKNGLQHVIKISGTASTVASPAPKQTDGGDNKQLTESISSGTPPAAQGNGKVLWSDRPAAFQSSSTTSSFQRTFVLPRGVDPASVHAAMSAEGDTLEVTFPAPAPLPAPSTHVVPVQGWQDSLPNQAALPSTTETESESTMRRLAAQGVQATAAQSAQAVQSAHAAQSGQQATQATAAESAVGLTSMSNAAAELLDAPADGDDGHSLESLLLELERA